MESFSFLLPSSVWWLLLFLNGISFFLMLWDKTQSRKSGAERISEGALFFLAIIFGSAGVFLGMVVFRHKTQRWYFMMGIPLLILQNIATLFFVNQFF